MPYLQSLSLLCLAATTVALTARPALRTPHCPARSALIAQLPPGWVVGIDQESGQNYYYNEHTGQSQWEPPPGDYGPGWDSAQQGYAKQVLWTIVPTQGVHQKEYQLRNGEDHVLGRYDMIRQSLYISREQCVVRVAADGTASLLSIGKPPTVVCSAAGECYGLQRGLAHALKDGERIALKATFLSDDASFDSLLGSGAGGPAQGIFTVYAQPDDDYAGGTLWG